MQKKYITWYYHIQSLRRCDDSIAKQAPQRKRTAKELHLEEISGEEDVDSRIQLEG